MKNLLSGTMLAEIFNLPSMTMIELDYNLLSGKLPEKMSGGSLNQLKAGNNSLTGKIPQAIGNFRNLNILSLENNRFEGEIPKEIFNLKVILSINISGNNISGEIPAFFSDCTSLTSVDLSRNSLYRKIPQGIGNLQDRCILNLSRNKLTGAVATDEIKYMTSLTALNLSYNNLTGRIPNDGQFFAFKETSFTGNPNLCLPSNVTCPPLALSAQSSGNKCTALFATSKLKITVTSLFTALTIPT